MRRFLLIPIALVSFTLTLSADTNWPQFRGAKSLGTSDDPNLPDTWSTTENVAWKTEIPGRGWASPIVWGDKVFLTSVVSEGGYKEVKKGLYFFGDQLKPPTDVHHWKVFCVDFNTGKVLWERLAHKSAPDSTIHIKNSFASETPVTDGERLYAYFGNLGVFCYDLNGNALWSKRLKPAKTRFGWGTAASPVVHKGRLYLVNDNEDESYLLALDAKTGKEVWRVNRDEKSNWATPFIWENEQRTEIVTPGTGKVRSYGLDGQVLWELKGMSMIAIPTPFVAHGMLYLSSGYVMDRMYRPVYALRPGAKGDISLNEGDTSNDFIAWSNRYAGPYNTSPLVYRDTLYVLYDRGFFAAFDAKSGKPHYAAFDAKTGRPHDDQKRLPVSNFTVSPWAYNGKIFCLNEDGETIVLEAGKEFKLSDRRNSLGELCMATPAIVRGSLLIRTETKLYKIQKGAK